MRPIRFGYQVTHAATADDLRSQARKAEAAGFDVVQVPDHVGIGDAVASSPFAVMMAMADATSRVRVGTLVLNNDLHHPVNVAREAAAINQLSEGRVELGLGAGHAFTEYHAMGLPFDPPAVRKARLAESTEIVRRLLDGEQVTFAGTHYQLEDVRVVSVRQERLTILVGVNGKPALAHAAQHADIIGLTMLGRTLEDGQRHSVRWKPEHLDGVVRHIRHSAGNRWPSLELNVLVQAVVITDDRAGAAETLARRIDGLSAEDALVTPFLAIGTHAQIADHFRQCRRRWGISYFSVRDIDALAPVVDLLTGE